MTSAFIIQVHSELQQDPNEETAALLRVLIHKIDNTTFGGDTPALPQWTGPSRAAIQVECILYASLAASLLSAFLAMLGKQWLNRYASIDMRGSAIERSQNRQRKLDGIVTWYFDNVLELLPLVLQGALLLLGWALSQYLLGIDKTIASVVLAVTSFGVLFYIFIVVAGATCDSCPYQTPWSNIIRRAPGLLRSAYALSVKRSHLHRAFAHYWDDMAKETAKGIITNVLCYPFVLLATLATDVFHLGRGAFRSLTALARRACRFFDTSFVQDQVLDNPTTKLDFHCILWMLQTSLDKTINISTINFLETILTFPGLSFAVVVGCFNILNSCIVVNGRGVAMVTHGSEKLAEIAAICFLRAFPRLSTMEPTSTLIRDVRQLHKRVFPSSVNLEGLPFTVRAIHHLFLGRQERPFLNWKDYNPSTDELMQVSCALAQAAQLEYHRGERERHKVPRWLLRFALHFLSRDPLPPTPVVIDCLTIIATDLGCNFSDNSIPSDERCAHN